MKRRERKDRRDAVGLNALTEGIIGAAIKVHQELGPGLLESAYEACLCFELRRQVYSVARQKSQPVPYDDLLVDCGYRLDLLVEDEVVVELKAAARVTKLDERQLLTYLRLSDCRVGLLINFNVLTLVEGIKRMVNEFPEAPANRSLRSPRPLRSSQACS